MVSELSFKARCVGGGFVIEIREKKIVSLKVDKNLYDMIEREWRSRGFSSRSHFLRNLVNDILNDGRFIEDLAKVNCEEIFIGSSSSKTLTFKIEKSVLEKLDKLVRKCGLSTRSDFLRIAIKYFLSKSQ